MLTQGARVAHAQPFQNTFSTKRLLATSENTPRIELIKADLAYIVVVDPLIYHVHFLDDLFFSICVFPLLSQGVDSIISDQIFMFVFLCENQLRIQIPRHLFLDIADRHPLVDIVNLHGFIDLPELDVGLDVIVMQRLATLYEILFHGQKLHASINKGRIVPHDEG